MRQSSYPETIKLKQIQLSLQRGGIKKSPSTTCAVLPPNQVSMGQWRDKFNYLLRGDVPPSHTCLCSLRKAFSRQLRQSWTLTNDLNES